MNNNFISIFINNCLSSKIKIKKNNNYLKYIYLNKKITIYLFLFLLSYFLYYLSLEKCLEGEDACGVKMKWMIKKLIELIISCIILSILLYLVIINNISRFNLIHIIFFFILIYNYSNGYTFNNHGYFNFIGYFYLLIFLLILFFLLKEIFYFFAKYFYSFIIIISLLFLTLFFFSLLINPINCDGWAKGLNMTYIYNDNNKYGCQIMLPKKCPYKVFKYFQDITKIKGIKCSNQKKNAKENILKLSKSPYLTKETNKIVFPLTNKNPICFLDSLDSEVLYNYFLSNLIDADNITNIKKRESEIEIDFSKNPFGEMNIKVNFNKTLSKKRKKKEKNTIPYSNNIMIIFFDSVSRANSIRQLKKTLNFIEKFISYKGGYNKKYPSENYHSFQFFKYHSFMEHTRGNYPLLIYGSKRTNKIIVRITKYLKENGYITSYAGDTCKRDNTRTLHNLTINEVDDHQMLLCDPNKENFNQNTIKCLYGKTHTEYLFEYTDQFWRKYKENRKFSLIVTNDAHEGTLEVLKYYDNIIYKYLNSLYNDNLFKESSIFLLSDHGVGMPSIYFLFDFYKYEEQLPMLYLIINDRKNTTYKEQYLNIYENQQTFITAYDIYNTISHLIYGNKYLFIKKKSEKYDTPKSPNGNSLFMKINKKNRTSKNYINMAQYVCE